jgi:tetratricopeptide (TPR) repeat protein
VLNSQGLVMKKRADYDAAEKLYDRAVRIIRKTFGEKHYKLGIYLNNLGDVERKRAKFDQALALYKQYASLPRSSLVVLF